MVGNDGAPSRNTDEYDSRAVTDPNVIEDGLKLHLGSGPHAIPGWENVDKSLTPLLTRRAPVRAAMQRLGLINELQAKSSWPPEVKRMNVSSTWPWHDGSASAVFSSHMVEHLEAGEVRHFLSEAFRVLKPTGVMRLALPDLQLAVANYLSDKQGGDERAADAFITYLYLRPEVHGSGLHRVLVRLLHRPHLWMYDFDSLAARIKDAGFVDITRCEYRQGSCPDVELLDSRPEDSFYLEALKP
jgi:SAM-dependent methyltransferase